MDGPVKVVTNDKDDDDNDVGRRTLCLFGFCLEISYFVSGNDARVFGIFGTFP